MKKFLKSPLIKFQNKRGVPPIHQAVFFETYAGCLIYLYGHFFTIHLFVRLLAFNHRETDARE
jgi:hypothetical protein